MVFDGILFAGKIKRELVESGKLEGKELVIFQTGDEESVYVRLKREMGESLGVGVEIKIVNDLERLKNGVAKAGEDTSVDGILVQLPIAGAGDEERDEILRLISPEKDVDGLNPEGSKFLPAAVVAVKKILKDLQGASLKVGVVGSRGVVGRALMKNIGCRTTHIEGFDVGDDLTGLKKCDVVISATGQAGLIRPGMVKEGVVAIDLGYPKPDFDEEVKERASVFTPVPGGVGPVSVVSLFENLAGTS